jgi:hypothetical protein
MKSVVVENLQCSRQVQHPRLKPSETPTDDKQRDLIKCRSLWIFVRRRHLCSREAREAFAGEIVADRTTIGMVYEAAVKCRKKRYYGFYVQQAKSEFTLTSVSRAFEAKEWEPKEWGRLTDSTAESKLKDVMTPLAKGAMALKKQIKVWNAATASAPAATAAAGDMDVDADSDSDEGDVAGGGSSSSSSSGSKQQKSAMKRQAAVDSSDDGASSSADDGVVSGSSSSSTQKRLKKKSKVAAVESSDDGATAAEDMDVDAEHGDSDSDASAAGDADVGADYDDGGNDAGAGLEAISAMKGTAAAAAALREDRDAATGTAAAAAQQEAAGATTAAALQEQVAPATANANELREGVTAATQPADELGSAVLTALLGLGKTLGGTSLHDEVGLPLQ